MNAGPDPDRPADLRAAWLALGAVLLVVGIAAIALAFPDNGLYWSDEVFQGLEPAHRLVFGYGLLPWECEFGARATAFFGLLAGLLKGAVWLGFDQPEAYLRVVKAAFVLVGMGVLAAQYLLGRALGAGALAATVGVASLGLCGPFLYFAPRPMAENVATLPAILGLALALSPTAGRGRLLGGSALVGLSAILRLQSGVFGVGLVGILLCRRRVRDALVASGVLLLGLLALGLLDRLTWGAWFHSPITYLRFNLLQGGQALYGTEGAFYYAGALWSSLGGLGVLAFGLAALAARRASGPLALLALMLVVPSLVAHKELRFVLPALPLLFALASVGLGTLAARDRRAAIALGLALLGLAMHSGLTAPGLTLGQVAHTRFGPSTASAWDIFGPVNRLLMRAGQQADLCGLKVHEVRLVWTGAYSALHRPVPLYGPLGPRLREGRFNYVIARLPGRPGREEVARDGPYRLLRLTGVACRPDPGFIWRVDPGFAPTLERPPRPLRGGPP